MAQWSPCLAESESRSGGDKTYEKTYVYCLHENLGVSSGGWVNKVPGSL